MTTDVEKEIGETLRFIVEGWLRGGEGIPNNHLTSVDRIHADYLDAAGLLRNGLDGRVRPSAALREALIDYLQAAYAVDREVASPKCFRTAKRQKAFLCLQNLIEQGIEKASAAAEGAAR